MVERVAISRRRVIGLVAGAFSVPFLSACFGQKDNILGQDSGRQKRIDAYLRQEPFQLLPRESILIDGVWVWPATPMATSAGDEVEIAVKAYTPPDSLPVKYVVFTAAYPGSKPKDPTNPSTWAIFDVVDHSDKNGDWVLRLNFKALGLKVGEKISLSFDLVNTANQRKYAPREIRDVYYKKGLARS